MVVQNQFYMVNLKAAKLYENFLPFNHAPDMWMNELFRKIGIIHIGQSQL